MANKQKDAGDWEKEFDGLFEDSIIVDGTVKTHKNGWLVGTHYPDDKDGGNIRKQLKTFISKVETQARQQERAESYTKGFNEGYRSRDKELPASYQKGLQESLKAVGEDCHVNMGDTATAPTREIPGNPGNEYLFAFEDGYNTAKAQIRANIEKRRKGE